MPYIFRSSLGRELLHRSREIFRSAFGLSSASSGAITKPEIATYLPIDPIVVEAGAHLGVDTFEMARSWPQGQIHAFEPIPNLFRSLESRARRYPNVHCYPYALSDLAGLQDIFVSSGASDASSSLRAPKRHLDDHQKVRFEERITVSTITLDQWASEYQIEHVDFLWLDVQGHELSVLKSATCVLRTVRALYLEVNLKEVYEGTPLYPEVRAWLESRGFAIIREQLPEGWDGGNVLAIKSG